MKAGQLDRRITIRKQGMIQDGYGGFIPGGWEDVATVWARVEQTSGREFFAAATVQSERRVVFRFRHLPGIDTTMSVFHEDREHNIREVREIGRREGLELHTTSHE